MSCTKKRRILDFMNEDASPKLSLIHFHLNCNAIMSAIHLSVFKKYKLKMHQAYYLFVYDFCFF